MSANQNVSGMNSANSHILVGQIFSSAGAAFNQLGELTSQLSQSTQNNATAGSGSSAKWSDEDVQLLHKAVTNFAQDLAQISDRIKGRTVSQIKTALKKKAFEKAGVPMNEEDLDSPSNHSDPLSSNSKTPTSSSDVTLNMLNASENEVDVEGISDKLDFDNGSALS